MLNDELDERGDYDSPNKFNNICNELSIETVNPSLVIV